MAGVQNLKPAEPGNLLAVTHGSTSEARIRPVARNQRRRVLRQLGTRAADLDPLGRAYLDLYVRLQAKLDLLDRHFAAVGLLTAKGEPQPATKFYVSLANSSRLSLARLEQHIHTRQSDPIVELQTYLHDKRSGA